MIRGLGKVSKKRFARGALVAFSLGALVFPGMGAAPGGAMLRMSGSRNDALVARSQHVGRLASDSPLTIAVGMKLRNPDQLADLIKRIHDPGDPLYGHYLTSEQFDSTYAPTADDVNQVSQYLTDRGLSVTRVLPGRMVIDVQGRSADIENAFQLEMHEYLTPSGRVGHAPSVDPIVSDAIQPKLSGITGLSTLARPHHHARQKPSKVTAHIGNGPGGGLAPADIRKAYNLDAIPLTGTGQTLALFELDGYTTANITMYTNQFAIANPPPLQLVPVDGATGTPSPAAECAKANTTYNCGEDEVELDIELMMAAAPGVTKILMYEAPNDNTTDQQLVDTYQKIADDNLAKSVSTSWGLSENESAAATLNMENQVFMKMAAQGQSMFAAAGDSGAYDDFSNNPNMLEVDDPASEPYVVGVGGTHLAINANGTYASESSWNTSSNPAEGGGGGISGTWPIPSWQTGLGTATNMGSQTMRMVPDVSLDGDPATGYSVYTTGAWSVFGGTSCAAPLWAAFTSLVNQQRAANAAAPLGFPNPLLYQIGASSLFTKDFHDVNDGSTNLHYKAVTGYDLSTGWGSFVGLPLFQSLVGGQLPPAAPASTSLTPHNRVLTITWAAVSGATSYNVARATVAGGPFVTIATGITVTNYTDTGLSNGVTYYYDVASVNAAGVGGASAPASGAAVLMAPEAPTSFTAVPQ